jgi:hypothetical protein
VLHLTDLSVCDVGTCMSFLSLKSISLEIVNENKKESDPFNWSLLPTVNSQINQRGD